MKLKKTLPLLLVLAVLVSCIPVHPFANPTPTPFLRAFSQTSIATSNPEDIKLRTVIEDFGVNDLVIGGDGSLWLLGGGKITDHKYSLVNLKNGKTTVYKISGDIFCGSDTADFSNLVADGKGVIWFSTSCTIYKFDGVNWTTYSQREVFFYPTIALDYSGNLWIGNEFGDVFRFDGKNWLSYKKNNGTQLASVESIIAGSDGAVWFGGDGGIAQFDGAKWTTFRKQDNQGRDIFVREMVKTKDNSFWVINFRGNPTVLEFNGEEWMAIDGFSKNIHTLYIDSKGNFWFGGKGRIFYFNGNWSELLIPSKLEPYEPMVFAIVETSDGTIWFATPDGLFSTIN